MAHGSVALEGWNPTHGPKVAGSNPDPGRGGEREGMGPPPPLRDPSGWTLRSPLPPQLLTPTVTPTRVTLPGFHTGGLSHCPFAVAKELVEGIGKSALAV